MMKSFNAAIVATALTALSTATALAAEPAAAEDPQPYAGLQTRDIKALSDARIDDYRNGRGMSLALAAELNGYPGPRHVLDLAGHLALTRAQRAKIQTLFDEMQAEAIDLGERIVARETEHDRLFAESTASPDAVESLALSISGLTAQLRFTHLRYHLDLREMLTADQIETYQTLRGYRSGSSGHGHGSGH